MTNSDPDPLTLEMETALRESEELFRTLCSRASVGIFTSNTRGMCTYVNNAGAEIMGVTPARAIQSGCLAAVHPDDRPRVEEGWEESLTTGVGFSSEYRFQHASGAVVWVQGDATARYDDQGELIGFIGTLTDITARKQTEHFLEAENQLLKAAARGLSLRDALRKLVDFIEGQAEDLIASILIMDADGKLLRHGAAPGLPATYNDALDALAVGEGFGACGTAAHRRMPVVVTDIESDPLLEPYRELARAQGLRACWSTPITDPCGVVLGTLAVYRRLVGGPTPRHCKLIDAATHIASILMARHRDERQLREGEARFRTIFEQAAVGVAQIDSPTGTIMRVNQRYCEILGTTSGDLIGKTWMELTHPDDLAADMNQMRRLRSGEIREFTMEKRLRRQDGSFAWINLTVSAMWPRGGQPTTHIAIVRDITQRKQMEEDLKTNAERLDLALSINNDGMFDWNLENDHVYFDDRYYTMAGYEPGEFPSAYEAWAKRVHPEDLASLEEAVQAYLAGKLSEFVAEFRFRRKQGDWMWICARTKLVSRDPEGKPIRLVGTHTDITARKRAEDALRDSERRFRMVFDQQFQFTAILSPDGRVEEINDLPLRVQGLRREDVVGEYFWNTPAWKSLPQWQEKIRKRIHQMASTDGPLLTEDRYRGADGDVRYAQTAFSCVRDDDGNIRFILAQAMDITERKQAEETLAFQADVLNQVSDAVMVTDREGSKITYANEVAEKLFQISKRPGQSLPALHDELLVSGPDSEVIRVSLENTGFWQGENEFRIDGQTLTMETKLKAFQLLGSNEQFLMSVVRDISARKKSEQERRQHRDALAHMTRLSTMGELVAGIAHEVRQPLYAIGNFSTAASISLRHAEQSQGMAANWLDDLNEFHDGIRRASQRANEIIERLRQFAQKSEQRREKTDINRVIHDSIDLVAFEARQCDTVVTTQLQHALPQIVADRIQCEQVVVNLLHNAYEALANQDSPRRVVVRTEYSDGQLEIQVEDNGPGIPADQKGRLFEAFSTTKIDGMGMGLAISRTIVEDHGGKLWVRRNEQGGSTFHVALPVVPITASLNESH